MATTYLTRTSGSPTLNTKYTLSFWVKRSKITYSECFMFDGRVDASNRFKLAFDANDKLGCFNSHSGSDTISFGTNRVFKDTSAWYNIILAVDTTQGTEADRVKLYVNGVQETSFSSITYPSQDDANNVFNENSSALIIGAYYNATNVFDGLMSYVAFVDGTAELPGIFGETDSTTGEWKIKTTITPSVAWGNNGFLILKNGNSLTDESSNSNNWTLGAGALTNTEDCPSNVFCTFNALNKSLTNLSLTNGNTTLSSTASGWYGSCGTLGFQKGFATYFEAKAKTIVYALTWGLSRIGEGTNGTPIINPPENDSNYDYMIRPTTANTVYYRGADQSVTVPAISAGDILSCLVSASGVVKFYINNVLIHTYSQVLEDNRFYFPVAGANGTGQGWDFNFGNGYFGTTAVASQGTNTSGIGIFEYDVPSGTAALSTKGLNL